MFIQYNVYNGASAGEGGWEAGGREEWLICLNKLINAIIIIVCGCIVIYNSLGIIQFVNSKPEWQNDSSFPTEVHEFLNDNVCIDCYKWSVLYHFYVHTHTHIFIYIYIYAYTYT